MAHLLKAIQREPRKTGFGDSLMVQRRHSVLRSSKPKARRKYLVCAKGLRNRLASMIEKNSLLEENEQSNRQRHLEATGWSTICKVSARLP